MSGIFSSLEIAKKALWTSQIALDVTSNNIANVNTPGYSRQRVDLTTSSPINLGFGPLGTGVDIGRITRARSAMLDGNLREAYSSYGYAESQDMILAQIDTAFMEPGDDGLSALISDFFNEWSNAANDPESSGARNAIIQKGMNLTTAFNRIAQKLNNTKAQIANDIDTGVKNINQILEEIASLNKKINYSEAGGAQANDLRDRRDAMLDKLSDYGKVNYVENSQGMFNVSFEGVTLVTGSSYSRIAAETSTDNDGTKQINLMLADTEQTFAVNGGKMGSMLNQFNQYIPEQMEKLDSLVASIAREVNKIHAASYGLPQGNPPQASTGINFFSGDSASTIKVHNDIVSNPDNIALSVSGEPGDTESALTIANLANLNLAPDKSQTFNEYYTSLTGQIGMDIQNNTSDLYQQDLIVAQLETQRDSFSGVNLDEEMINLTRFQRSFEAATKVIKTIDEMMQTIINLK